MSINFIPNDPKAAASAPGMRVQPKRKNRPASRAAFTMAAPPAEGVFELGSDEFLFWQCREGALAAVEAWEAVAGPLKKWQGGRKKLLLEHDAGVQLNAFYDRASFSFFHRTIGSSTVFSGASTDVVAHEIGHGLLDVIRPDVWDIPFLEVAAFHEAFGDCLALLTAFEDKESREALLAVAPTLRKKNFVESTAEDLANGIKRLIPGHNAGEARRAFNKFKFQIPETLPDDGGPGKLINEAHSFGMLFSGCFWDTIANIFAAMPAQSEANLLAAARTAGKILVEGAKAAPAAPRFLQSVGRSMVLADEQLNGGANRNHIRDAFAGHAIALGTSAMLAASSTLAGAASTRMLSGAARKDLLGRLGGGKLAVSTRNVFGQKVVSAVHEREVPLDRVDKRLKGVVVLAQEPVMIGSSGKRAAVLGGMPDPAATESEAQAFVRSLVAHNLVDMGGGARMLGATGGAGAPTGATHRIATVGAKRVLKRIGFNCRFA